MALLDFLSVKNLVRDAAAALREGEAKSNDLRQRLLTLQTAGVAKSDLLRALDAWVDEMAAGFTQSISIAIRGLTQASRDSQTEKALSRGVSVALGNAFRGEVASRDETVEEVRVRAQLRMMCALFGPQVKKALANAVNELTWDQGLPIAERPAAMDLIRVDLRKVNMEVTQLRQDAADAGVKL